MTILRVSRWYHPGREDAAMEALEQDTFYVPEGRPRLFLRDPKEEVRPAPGETSTVRARRPHLVTNGGETSAVFLVLQGLGEYDYVPLT
jgi:hypothetical protein